MLLASLTSGQGGIRARGSPAAGSSVALLDCQRCAPQNAIELTLFTPNG
jgi:hypothetical protein